MEKKRTWNGRGRPRRQEGLDKKEKSLPLVLQGLVASPAYLSSQDSLSMQHLPKWVSLARFNTIIEVFTKGNFRRNYATYILTRRRAIQPTYNTNNAKSRIVETWKHNLYELNSRRIKSEIQKQSYDKHSYKKIRNKCIISQNCKQPSVKLSLKTKKPLTQDKLNRDNRRNKPIHVASI